MDISSIYYLVFILVVMFIYWYLPYKMQWVWLLLVSIFFYYKNAPLHTLIYVLLNVSSVYTASILMEKIKHKRLLLVVTIVFNVLILSTLKYLNFLLRTINIIFKTNIQDTNFVASLAISFYLLALLAYLLEVYWGIEKAEKNPLKLLLFTIFFPLMTSGPISKHEKLSQQLFEKHRFEYKKATDGLKRIAVGIFKKRCIAGQVALMVDVVYSDFYHYHGVCIWLATFLYAIQLYMDFSGCMDIVIGSAKCMGIVLEENFNSPFFSRTMQEFWRRWHITLGGWLRNYIMNPLLKTKMFIELGNWGKKQFGKKQGKKISVYLAMLILWSFMGLWHGDSWKYIVGEGWWFWLVIVLEQTIEPVGEILCKRLKISKEHMLLTTICRMRTFFCFSVGMVFFRGDSLSDAVRMLGQGVHFTDTMNLISEWIVASGILDNVLLLVMAVMGILGVWIIDGMNYAGKPVAHYWDRLPALVRMAGYWCVSIVMIYLLCDVTEVPAFIYNQF